MHNQPILAVLDSTHFSHKTTLKRLALALVGLVALQAINSAYAQNLNAEPLFGSISLEAGFESTPYTIEIAPGGEDLSSNLGADCFGYIRFGQPDFVLNYQSGDSSLGVFAISDLDITMAINDPAGNWHCNDDSIYLSGTNSGIQFNDPLSGDYQIWVGSYDIGSESIVTMLAITEADESEWAAIPVGLEDSVYAASYDLNGDIVFGDDSSAFANDGECDDPRFQGSGMAFGSTSDHLFKDATDCRTQFEAGMISLAEPEDMNLSGDIDLSAGDADLFGTSVPAANPLAIPDAGPLGEVLFALAQAFQAIPGDRAGTMPIPFGLGGDTPADYDRASMTALTGIDFGDNSSVYANDGECDDPRFEGPGAADFTLEGDELSDGNDCSNLYLAGSLTYIDNTNSASAAPDVIVDSSGIIFGDNSSIFADDGECDDPRFEGPGVAISASSTSEMRDANDCRIMFETGQAVLVAGTVPSSSTSPSIPTSQTLTPEPEAYTVGTPRGDINGAQREDGSLFASGTVYGDPLNASQATNAGNLSRSPIPNASNLSPAPTRSAPAGSVDFGDNTSIYANDGECDDPRFEGAGMAAISFDDDIRRDANDCRAAYQAGTITLIRS